MVGNAYVIRVCVQPDAGRVQAKGPHQVSHLRLAELGAQAEVVHTLVGAGA